MQRGEIKVHNMQLGEIKVHNMQLGEIKVHNMQLGEIVSTTRPSVVYIGLLFSLDVDCMFRF
jgi:hypothetical protein